MAPQTTATSMEEFTRTGGEFGPTPLARFGREERRESEMQAPAVERLLERVEGICSTWTPARDIDVEEMLRRA